MTGVTSIVQHSSVEKDPAGETVVTTKREMMLSSEIVLLVVPLGPG